MIEHLSIYEMIMLTGALIGVYVKMTQEIGKLKSRMTAVEGLNGELKDAVKELIQVVNDLKLMLAREGLDGKPTNRKSL